MASSGRFQAPPCHFSLDIKIFGAGHCHPSVFPLVYACQVPHSPLLTFAFPRIFIYTLTFVFLILFPRPASGGERQFRQCCFLCPVAAHSTSHDEGCLFSSTAPRACVSSNISVVFHPSNSFPFPFTIPLVSASIFNIPLNLGAWSSLSSWTYLGCFGCTNSRVFF